MRFLGCAFERKGEILWGPISKRLRFSVPPRAWEIRVGDDLAPGSFRKGTTWKPPAPALWKLSDYKFSNGGIQAVPDLGKNVIRGFHPCQGLSPGKEKKPPSLSQGTALALCRERASGPPLWGPGAAKFLSRPSDRDGDQRSGMRVTLLVGGRDYGSEPMLGGPPVDPAFGSGVGDRERLGRG